MTLPSLSGLSLPLRLVVKEGKSTAQLCGWLTGKHHEFTEKADRGRLEAGLQKATVLERITAMRVRSSAILVVVGLATWTSAQEIPPIRVPVRLVSVPALVFSRDNQLIPGLQISNFQILDNGRPQSIRLEAVSAPISLAVVIQVNSDVRQYVPFIAKTGSAIDALIAGESGEVAVIAYSDDVPVIKPFGVGDVLSAVKTISSSGRSARMTDAGVRATKLLAERSLPGVACSSLSASRSTVEAKLRLSLYGST
jgi:hypothetical protein